MGAWEKLQLGWLDCEVARAGTKSTHKLGPSYHATKKTQAVIGELPKDSAGNGRYYLAENRQYLGYDATLETGPYNFGWPLTSPDRVEHFPYQNGLSVNYWNTALGGTVARNRIQTFDATFGLERTDPISLHRETEQGMTTLGVPSRPAVPVFDDIDPNAYYDAANPMGSVKVAGVGVSIKVVQSNKTGKMTVKVNG